MSVKYPIFVERGYRNLIICPSCLSKWTVTLDGDSVFLVCECGHSKVQVPMKGLPIITFTEPATMPEKPIEPSAVYVVEGKKGYTNGRSTPEGSVDE